MLQALVVRAVDETDAEVAVAFEAAGGGDYAALKTAAESDASLQSFAARAGGPQAEARRRDHIYNQSALQGW